MAIGVKAPWPWSFNIEGQSQTNTQTPLIVSCKTCNRLAAEPVRLFSGGQFQISYGNK